MPTAANARQLTKNEIAEGNASLSPDDSTVAFTAGANEKFDSYYNDKIFLIPAAGGTPRVLLAERHVRGRDALRGPRTASRCSSPRTWACTTS